MPCGPEMMAPVDIHGLIGLGIRARREELGWRQEDAAQVFRGYGLPAWRRSTVAQVEAGTRRPSLGDLLIVAAALRCTLADLVPSGVEEGIDVGAGAVMPSATVKALLSAGVKKLPGPIQVPDQDAWLAKELARVAAERERLEPQMKLIREHSPRKMFLGDQRKAFLPAKEAEARAAERLGVPAALLKYAARALWGRDFDEERDARAGNGSASPQAVQARRGHATRTMLAELRAFLDLCGLGREEQGAGGDPDG